MRQAAHADWLAREEQPEPPFDRDGEEIEGRYLMELEKKLRGDVMA